MTFDLAGATARIVNMLMEVNGITLAATAYPGTTHEQIPDADMPFVWVEMGNATYAPFASDILVTTREWLLLLYAEKFLTTDKADEDAAWAACSPYLVSVPKYFATHKRLSLNDNGFPGVDSVDITTDDGPDSASRKLEFFYGAAFRLRVIYSEYTR